MPEVGKYVFLEDQHIFKVVSKKKSLFLMIFF